MGVLSDFLHILCAEATYLNS